MVSDAFKKLECSVTWWSITSNKLVFHWLLSIFVKQNLTLFEKTFCSTHLFRNILRLGDFSTVLWRLAYAHVTRLLQRSIEVGAVDGLFRAVLPGNNGSGVTERPMAIALDPAHRLVLNQLLLYSDNFKALNIMHLCWFLKLLTPLNSHIVPEKGGMSPCQ